MLTYNNTDISNVTSRVERWTPDLARDLLQNHNKRNRPIRDVVIKRYQEDMARGLYLFTGEPIIIDNYGELLDGQHRLQALINSGVIIHFLTVRGVPRDQNGMNVAIALDNGFARRFLDYCKIRYGEDVDKQAAVACATIYALDNRQAATYVSNFDRDAVMLENLRDVEWVASLKKDKLTGIGPYLGAVAWLHSIYPEDIEVFHKRVSTGVGLEEDSPELSLRSFLSNPDNRAMIGSPKHRFELSLKVLNAFDAAVNNRTLKKLYARQDIYDRLFEARAVAKRVLSYVKVRKAQTVMQDSNNS